MGVITEPTITDRSAFLPVTDRDNASQGPASTLQSSRDTPYADADADARAPARTTVRRDHRDGGRGRTRPSSMQVRARHM